MGAIHQGSGSIWENPAHVVNQYAKDVPFRRGLKHMSTMVRSQKDKLYFVSDHYAAVCVARLGNSVPMQNETFARFCFPPKSAMYLEALQGDRLKPHERVHAKTYRAQCRKCQG